MNATKSHSNNNVGKICHCRQTRLLVSRPPTAIGLVLGRSGLESAPKQFARTAGLSQYAGRSSAGRARSFASQYAERIPTGATRARPDQ